MSNMVGRKTALSHSKFWLGAILAAGLASALPAQETASESEPDLENLTLESTGSGQVAVRSAVLAAREAGEQIAADSEGARVFGGRPAREGAWPAIVSLHSADIPDYSRESLFRSQFCGGTVITNQWVLTAAHCVVSDEGDVSAPDSVLIRGHSNILDSGVLYEAEGIYAHAGYDRRTVDNDIALIKLSQPVQADGRIDTIPLITANSATPEGPAVVAGWGMMENERFPSALMETDIRVVTNSTCNRGMAEQTKREIGGFLLSMGRANRIPMEVLNEAYGRLIANLGPALTGNMICAGVPTGRQTSCNGDSGGPLMMQAANGEWLQVGIVSWGREPLGADSSCGHQDLYAVYTRVSNYLGWIENVIANY